MSGNVDNRIVNMEFNNSQFEKGIDTSLKSLDELKKNLKFDSTSGKGIEQLGHAVEGIASKFTFLGRVSLNVMDRIANKAIQTGERLIKSLTVDQLSAGWTKYGQKTESVRTIMNSTGKSIDEVNQYLEKLMWFSDETSYGFTDMTAALGQLTSAGGDAEKLIPMIMGIANATAFAGKGTGEFSRAIYNLNQSYSSGHLQFMDWRSLELAGIASKDLKQVFIDSAVALGKLSKEGKTASGELVSIANFGQTLRDGWADTEVMEKAFGYFAEMTEKAYEMVQNGEFELASEAYAYLAEQYDGVSITAAKAAQEAKSFTEAIDATKDAVSSGWMRSFEYVFGNYAEAKTMWTDLANWLWDVFAASSETRNEILETWHDIGGREELLEGVYDIFEALKSIIDSVKEAFHNVFPETTVYSIKRISSAVKDFGAKMKAAFVVAKKFNGIEWEEKEVKIGGLEELENSLKRGAKGDDVKKMQERLIELGYNLDKYGADGIFGPETQKALEEFEKKYGLTIDGLYDEEDHKKMGEFFGGHSIKVMEAVRQYVDEMPPELENLKKILNGVFSVLGIGFKILKFVWSVGTHILSLFKPIGEALLYIAGGVGDLFGNLNDWLGENDVFSEWLEKIKTWLQPFGDWLSNAGVKMKEWFDGLISSIKEAGGLKAVWDKFKKSVTESKVWKTFGTAWEKLKKSFSTIKEPLKKAWTDLKTYLGDKFGSLFGSVSEKMPGWGEKISAFFLSIVDWISGKIEKIPAAIEKIKTFFSGLMPYISKFAAKVPGWIGAVKTFFVDMFSSIKGSEKLKAWWNKIKGIFSSIVTWVKKIFGVDDKKDSPFTKVKDQLNKFLNPLDGLGENGTDSGAGEKTNTFISTIQTVWGAISNGLTWLWDTISNLFSKIDIGKLVMWSAIIVIALSAIQIFRLIGAVRKFATGIADLSEALAEKLGHKKKSELIPQYILAIAASIAVLAAAVYVLGSMDPNALIRGSIAVGGIIIALTAMAIVVKKADLGATATAFRDLGIGVAALVAAILVLGLITKDAEGWKTLGRGLVGIMVLLGALRLFLIGFQGKDTNLAISGIEKLAIAIDLLVIAVAVLGKMNFWTMAQGLVGLLAIVGILKLLLKSMPKKGVLKMSGFIALAIGIDLLVGALFVLGHMKVTTIVKGLAALLGIVILLKMVIKSIGKNKVSDVKGALSLLIGMAGLVIVMVAFGKVVKKLDNVDTTTMVAFAGSLTAMMIGLGVFFKLVGSLSWVGIAKGLVAMIGAVTILGGLIALLDQIGLTSSVGKGIGNFLGSMKAAEYSSFAKGFNAYQKEMKKVDPTDEELGKKTDYAIEIADSLNKFASELGTISLAESLAIFASGGKGSLGRFATDMAGFGEAFNAYATEMSAVTPDDGVYKDLESKTTYATGIAKSVAALASSVGETSIGDALSLIFTKKTNFGRFLTDMKGFGEAFNAYATEIKKVSSTDAEQKEIIQKTGFAKGIAQSILTLANEVGETTLGGLITKFFTGKTSFGQFQTDMTGFAKAFNAYKTEMLNVEMSSSEQKKLDTKTAFAVSIAKSIASVSKELGQATFSESLVALATQKTSFGNFLEGMGNFGTTFNTYKDQILGIEESDEEALKAKNDKAIEAAQALADFMVKVVELPSLEGNKRYFFFGKTRPEELMDLMTQFSTTVSGVASSLETMTDPGLFSARMTAATTAAQDLANFFGGVSWQSFDDRSFFEKLFDEDSNNETFISLFKKFGEGVGEISTSMRDVDPKMFEARMDAAQRAAVKMADFLVATSASNIGEITADTYENTGWKWVEVTSNFTALMEHLGTLGRTISTFNSDTEGVDLERFTTLISPISSLAESLAELSSVEKPADVSGIFDQLRTALSGESLSGDIDTSGWKDACSEGISAVKSMTGGFSDAGRNLSAGLARGILQGKAEVINAAIDVAKAALKAAQDTLDEKSPSRATAEMGLYFDKGLGNGIMGGVGEVVKSASYMGDKALDTLSASLSGMPDVFSDEFDTDPVIRPVVDLTGVSQGANAITGMLSRKSTISLGANTMTNAYGASQGMTAAQRRKASVSESSKSSSADSSVPSTVTFSNNNFSIRNDQDIHNLANEIAALTRQQQRGLGAAPMI